MVRLSSLRGVLRKTAVTPRRPSPGDVLFFAVKNSKGRLEGERTPLVVLHEFGNPSQRSSDFGTKNLQTFTGTNLLLLTPELRKLFLSEWAKLRKKNDDRRSTLEFRNLSLRFKYTGEQTYVNSGDYISVVKQIPDEVILDLMGSHL